MNSTIQRILVPLDPSPYTEAATLRACEVARRHYAQVTGLAVLDSPEIRQRFAPVEVSHWPSIRESLAAGLEQAEQIIGRAKERFAMTCDAEHVAHSEEELSGAPASIVTEIAALYDLIVMGLRTHFHFETRETEGDSLAKILDQTTTPVLAVPARTGGSFQRVLIAYDGSFPAARAIRDFAGFARPYEFEIHVFASGSDRAQSEALLERAAAYLRSHDLHGVKLHPTSQAPWDFVQKEFLGATDLVVAGIHSRKFIVDPFVGSFTRNLIEAGQAALFLSH